jgi:DNA-binding protein HU-beta
MSSKAVPCEKEVVVNKSDVIQGVAGETGMSRQDVEQVIDAFFDTVRGAVSQGDRVAWPSFGSFSASERQARTGRNPRTGEAVAIPASRAVKFSASTALKTALNPPPAKAAKKGAKKSAAPAKKGTGTAKAPAAAPKKAEPTKKTATKTATKAPASKAPAKKSAKKTSK